MRTASLRSAVSVWLGVFVVFRGVSLCGCVVLAVGFSGFVLRLVLFAFRLVGCCVSSGGWPPAGSFRFAGWLPRWLCSLLPQAGLFVLSLRWLLCRRLVGRSAGCCSVPQAGLVVWLRLSFCWLCRCAVHLLLWTPSDRFLSLAASLWWHLGRHVPESPCAFCGGGGAGEAEGAVTVGFSLCET